MIIDPDEHPQRHSEPELAFADAARRLRDEVLVDPEVREVFVMVGPPGSGKSTLARRLGAVVVLDGCHSNAAKRRALAKQIRDAGKLPIAIWLRTALEECLRRNNRRDPPRRVPPSVVRRMARELEIRPPRRAEGWHEVREVRS